MEEAAFCTMLGLNVGPYRKQLRFREVPLGQGATLPMCLATMIFVLNTVPRRMHLRSGRFRTKWFRPPPGCSQRGWGCVHL